jgi:hypothetical protein
VKVKGSSVSQADVSDLQQQQQQQQQLGQIFLRLKMLQQKQ